jgi:uncharacterized damage-inducible protein DinB
MTTTAALTHPHLRTLLADAEATRTETECLRDTLTSAQLTWHPEPGVWSVADCFEHLRKIDKAYCRELPEALSRAEPGDPPYRPGLFARWFIRLVSPESSFKVKTPKATRPKPAAEAAGSEALDRFLAQQAEVIDLIQRADGKDINTGKLPSPLASILKFSVGEALTMLVRHEQRHLGQAQRLTERADFPRAEAG